MLDDTPARHGDVVLGRMPGAPARVTVGCTKWHDGGMSHPRCSAVYADPATPAEMERTRAARPLELRPETRDGWRR